MSVLPVRAEPDHLVFPFKDWGQSILGTDYVLDQKEPHDIAWGVFARQKGIDSQLKPSHHKFGMEIFFYYSDGTHDCFVPEQKFTAAHDGWQSVCGVYRPRKPVKKATFFRRLAVAGEAWFDGMGLFEVRDEVTSPCSVHEGEGGDLTLENSYLRCVVNAKEGAVVKSLIDKKTGIDYTDERPTRCMFLDKFRTGGNCWVKPWKCEVKRRTADEVAIELRMNGPRGYEYLDVIRTMRLTRDSSALDVAYRWHNQPASMGELVVEPQVAHGCSPRKTAAQGVYLPTSKGVLDYGPVGGTVKTRDVIGGWYAAHGEGAHTMAFEFDWSRYAETWFYFAGNDNFIADMIQQPVSIPAGGDHETEQAFFPLASIGKPDWVENGLAAEFAVDGRVALRLDAAKPTTLNVAVAARYRDGTNRVLRTLVRPTPSKGACIETGFPLDGLSSVTMRAYSGNALVFEAMRSMESNFTYAPRRKKAKPAEVKPFRLDVPLTYSTPHTDWAHPYAGGRPKVLFITDIHHLREIVELAQRIDIEPHVVRVSFDENTTSWAMIERFGTYRNSDFNISLKKELETKFDAIFIAAFNGREMSYAVDGENRTAIARQLETGTGLVTNHRDRPALADNASDARAFISGNVSPRLLPFGAAKYSVEEKPTHREVRFHYEAKGGLTPYVHYTDRTIPDWPYQDYSLSVIGRAILWAAKMAVASPKDAKLREAVAFEGPGLKIRHWWKETAAGVADWGAEAIDVPKTAALTAFEIVQRKEGYAIGEEVVGSLKTSSGAASVKLRDGFGRLLACRDGVVGDFALKIPEARTGMLTVEATLRTGAGTVADRKAAKVICRRPWTRPEYVVGLSEGWVTYGGEKQYLTPFRMKMYGQTGVNLIRFWESDREDAYRQLLPYGYAFDFSVYDARLGADNFARNFLEPYAKTKDRKYLCRKPCFNDPEYRRRLDAATAANVARVAKYSPYTCDCGDENSLTRWNDAFDFCFCDHTLRAMRAWLKSEYGDLASLNRAWRTSFADWETVMPDTTEEARERARRTGEKSYAAWADHRRFMELTFCQTFERLAEILHGRLPETPLDMSGTQPPNGWTGMDLWLLSKSVTEPAAYDGGYVGEAIRSFGDPLVKPWAGYGDRPVNVRYRQWNTLFRYRNAGIYFWTCFNFLNPDYTPTPTALEYGRTAAEIASGAARLRRSLVQRDEYLIHYSQASVHAAQIEDRYADFLKRHERWCADLRERGIPFRYVAYAEIEDGVLDTLPGRTLVLPRSAAVSDREAAAIMRFAKTGGRVVKDGEVGVLDQHCARRALNALAGVGIEAWALPDVPSDQISAYPLYPHDGVEGRYWGFTRALTAEDGVASRTVALDEAAYVYDLRAKRCHGKVDRFTTSLEKGEAAFFAALPYEVGAIRVVARGARPGGCVEVTVMIDVPSTARACHPVRIDVYDPSGSPSKLYGGIIDASGGKGEWMYRTALDDAPDGWRVVATDYITGKTAACAVASGED